MGSTSKWPCMLDDHGRSIQLSRLDSSITDSAITFFFTDEFGREFEQIRVETDGGFFARGVEIIKNIVLYKAFEFLVTQPVTGLRRCDLELRSLLGCILAGEFVLLPGIIWMLKESGPAI